MKGEPLELEYVRTDKNGTKIYHDWNCPRCGGHGYIWYYTHVEAGVCFQCGGSGRRAKAKIVKEYTPEYRAKLDARNEAKRQKKLAEDIARSGEVNQEFFSKNGFNKDGNTYVVLGDTFAIKDELKEAGAKFSNLGWSFAEKPDKYETVEINVDDVYFRDYRNMYSWKNWLSNDEEKWSEKIRQANDNLNRVNSTSEYLAEVGEKVDLKVKLIGVYEYGTNFSYYGEMNYIYTFKDEKGNVVVWKTSKDLCFDNELKEGDEVSLKGTVKALDEYKGVKQTVLTRCKVA